MFGKFASKFKYRKQLSHFIFRITLLKGLIIEKSLLHKNLMIYNYIVKLKSFAVTGGFCCLLFFMCVLARVGVHACMRTEVTLGGF